MRKINIASKVVKLTGGAKSKAASGLSKLVEFLFDKMEDAEITYNPSTKEIGVKFKKEI